MITNSIGFEAHSSVLTRISDAEVNALRRQTWTTRTSSISTGFKPGVMPGILKGNAMWLFGLRQPADA